MFGSEIIELSDLLKNQKDVIKKEIGNSTRRISYAFDLPWAKENLQKKYSFLVSSSPKIESDLEKYSMSFLYN